MSDADSPAPTSGHAPTPPPPPPQPRNGCLTAFMVLAGIVLLLPGLCAVVFGVASIYDPRNGAGFMPFVLIGLLVGFGGVMLIRAAIRGPR